MNTIRCWPRTSRNSTIQSVIRECLRAIGVSVIGDGENFTIVRAAALFRFRHGNIARSMMLPMFWYQCMKWVAFWK